MSSKKTSKQKRAEIAAKRKRMGLKATDADDADDGVAYDPQLLTIARSRKFIQVFEKKAGSLHGEVDFDEFCECLTLLEIKKYDMDIAKKAFRALDFEKEEALEFEAFVQAVYGAYPQYNAIWKELMKAKRYIHFSTIEGPYSPEQLKAILKQKKGDFKEQLMALRVCGDMIATPDIKDRDCKNLIVKLLPGLLAALRSKNAHIVRNACMVLSDIAKSKKGNLKSQVSKILNVCWEIYDCPDALSSFSALMLSKCLLRYVPDDADNKVLKTLIQGTTLKDFASVQRGCYEGIKVYLKKAGNPKAKIKPGKEFWELTKNVISDGLKQDEDRGKRQFCYELLVVFERSNEKKATRILTAFNKKQETEYNKVKNGGNMDDKDVDNESEESDEKKEERQVWEPDVSKRGPRVLSRDYEERKEELSESFDAYDDEGEGFISNDRCRQFVRDLFDVVGKDSDIAVKGLDTKLDGHISKARMLKWGLAHSWKKVRKNVFLEKEGVNYGYKASRKERLEQRVELYDKLKEIELAEHNYAALYDIDHRMCILNYFIKQKK